MTLDIIFNINEKGVTDQVGDIKLEYRFPLAGIVKGALFYDMGNIWLIRENPSKPGGMFNINIFYEQLGAGIGIGIRIDASFFVLRLDFDFPLRKPYLAENERWVINTIDFGDPD